MFGVATPVNYTLFFFFFVFFVFFVVVVECGWRGGGERTLSIMFVPFYEKISSKENNLLPRSGQLPL